MSADATESFLSRFHAEHPGCTSSIFGDAVADDGRSSYERLAAHVEAGDAVLDLGCGDGGLLALAAARGARSLCGVDLSAAELALARSRPALAGARLVEARAEAHGLAAASVDVVLSHLGLGLMHRLDAVLGEVRTVLRPGGRLAAVLPAGLPTHGGLRIFAEAFSDCLVRFGGAMQMLGEPAGQDPEALIGLVERQLDGVAEREAFSVVSRVPASVLSERLLGLYNAHFLDDAGRRALRGVLPERLAAAAAPDGLVTFEAPLVLFSVTQGRRHAGVGP